MTINAMREALRKKDFLLLRQGRSVIQDGALLDRLAHLPPIERDCPVREILWRRAGIR